MELVMFEEQLLVQLPDSFTEKEKSRIDGMYPYEEKPQIILEDESTHRFCTFSQILSQKLTENQLEYAIKEVCSIVTSLYPSCLLEEPRLIYCQGGRCGCFSFRAAGMEGELFHVMYILPVNGCMVLGTAGCTADDKEGEKWMMEMIRSLKPCKKKYSFEIKRKELYYKR